MNFAPSYTLRCAFTHPQCKEVRLLDMGLKLIGQRGSGKTIRFLRVKKLNMYCAYKSANWFYCRSNNQNGNHLNNFTFVICFANGDSNGTSDLASSNNLTMQNLGLLPAVTAVCAGSMHIIFYDGRKISWFKFRTSQSSQCSPRSNYKSAWVSQTSIANFAMFGT